MLSNVYKTKKQASVKSPIIGKLHKGGAMAKANSEAKREKHTTFFNRLYLVKLLKT